MQTAIYHFVLFIYELKSKHLFPINSDQVPWQYFYPLDACCTTEIHDTELRLNRKSERRQQNATTTKWKQWIVAHESQFHFYMCRAVNVFDFVVLLALFL